MPRARLICFLAMIMLQACRPATQASILTPAAGSPVVAQPTQTHEPGTATVTGRVTSAATGEAYVNIPVRLAEIIDLGDDVDDTFILDDAQSPGTLTDSQGYFVLSNVEPKAYVVLVGDVNMAYAVPTDTPDHAIVLNLEADQTVDIGELSVTLH